MLFSFRSFLISTCRHCVQLDTHVTVRCSSFRAYLDTLKGSRKPDRQRSQRTHEADVAADVASSTSSMGSQEQELHMVGAGSGLLSRLAVDKYAGRGVHYNDSTVIKELYSKRFNKRKIDFIRVLRRYNFTLPQLENQTLLAKVLKVEDKRVLVDPGYHGVSEVPRRDLTLSHVHAGEQELEQRATGDDIRPGDNVKLRLDTVFSPYGDMFLEAGKEDPELRKRRIIDELKRHRTQQQPVMGRVLNGCDGGFAVGVAGVVAFLPYNKAAMETVNKVGILQPFYVDRLEPERGRIVLSDPKASRRRRQY